MCLSDGQFCLCQARLSVFPSQLFVCLNVGRLSVSCGPAYLYVFDVSLWSVPVPTFCLPVGPSLGLLVLKSHFEFHSKALVCLPLTPQRLCDGFDRDDYISQHTTLSPGGNYMTAML